MEQEITVSILCTAYNHEKYIADAIEGFLMQETNYRYEIILHDDVSIDRTADIMREYEMKYPDLIRGIYQCENQFSKNQPSLKWYFDLACRTCRGKYIAICEGDDYWIDPQKLQLQVDYLENHQDCMLVIHDTVEIDYRNFRVKSWKQYAKDGIVPKADIITQKVLVPTASTMYRKEILEMDGFFSYVGVGDYPMLLYAISKGSIFYFTRIMSAYRRYHEGSWSASMQSSELFLFHNIRMINFLIQYNVFTNNNYDKYIVFKIQTHSEAVITLCKDMTLSEFIEMCKRHDRKVEKKHYEFFEKISRLLTQIRDEKYVDEDVCQFVKKQEKIIIMGAGSYASILEKQFKYHGIEFEGYVISDNQDYPKESLSKPVWKMRDLPYDVHKIGVIIGINPINWLEIVDTLNKKGIENYICPFLFK